MPHTTLWEIPTKKTDKPNERSLQLLYSSTSSATRRGFLVEHDATVLVSTIYPHGGRTGVHTHPVDELIYVVSGRGYGAEGRDRFAVGPGTIIYAQANVSHDCVNVGNETMTLVCVYLPSLPKEAVEGLLKNASLLPTGHEE